MTERKNIAIMGAGLVGSLLSLYLAKHGHKVDLYERRADLRVSTIDGGRSINLALSDRGWRALKGLGIEEEVRKVAIPMYGRMMHDEQGNLTHQPYGKEGQAIYSVSRGGLNMALMNLSEPNQDITYHFNRQATDVNLRTNEVQLRNVETGNTETIQPDLLFGADGAYSVVRGAMQKAERFDYQQSYLEYGYKELTIPATADGGWAIEKNALHIWPRGNYMMIALPNPDGSFTCTLFFPYDGEHSFAAIQDKNDLLAFFNKVFPDAVPLMPELAQEYFENPVGALVTVKCFPWSYKGTSLLIGDASHAVVPFYGQGMNAGFEDITVLDQMLQQFEGDDWEALFKAFERRRKPNADAIADLAVLNFEEMRDKVADPRFLLRKKIENKISAQYPDKWIPLYTMVTFTDLPYSYALETGQKQDKIMKKVMRHIKSLEDYDKPEVQQLLEKQLVQKEKLTPFRG
ncbi:FAD-dependent oxidoreductase [Pontibacter akesuensis]|uniref:Kynurenine 3-monooxygenase n=1 Tax=Pontibacter akesuensis TaxID=388950 RepID=A0A1I7HUC4_9BACT|nr:NAD(P)/FAD-dependent oxidoreductase [Pontibacter akesuensis]GHA63522.1 kynurenine 3-monooxygenase [Pontibacter akesuensis]SFU64086.1 kynurenine 3-monooxygenase [Pontibacter akesuensis]